MTLFVNKATVEPADERHARLTWGAAQAGVAAGVMHAHRKGVLRADDADDLVLVAAVWVNPAADDEEAVYANNADATLRGADGRARRPAVDPDRARRGRAAESILPRMTPEQAAHEAPRGARPGAGRGSWPTPPRT